MAYLFHHEAYFKTGHAKMLRLVGAYQSRQQGAGGGKGNGSRQHQQRGGPAGPVRPVTTRLKHWSSDPVCRICSTGNSTVRHVHASSEFDRREAVAAGRTSFYCISCGRRHDTTKPARRQVLLTSSTLYRFDKAPGWTNTGHFDVEAIVGGTINDGHEVFQLLYGTQPEPVDVVIVLGINNILKNHSTDRVTTDINNLKNTVYKHSVLFNHRALGLRPNTAAACPLILPPRLASFVRPHVVPADFVDKKDQILTINNIIIRQGRATGEKVPCYMNTLGIRTDKHGKSSHRRGQWREDEWRRKLHLCPELKAYAARRIARYFLDLAAASHCSTTCLLYTSPSPRDS